MIERQDCGLEDSAGLECAVDQTNAGYDVTWSGPKSEVADDVVVRRKVSLRSPFHWRARSDGDAVSDGPTSTGSATYLVITRVGQRIDAATTCTDVPPPPECPARTRIAAAGYSGDELASSADGRLWFEAERNGVIENGRTLRTIQGIDPATGEITETAIEQPSMIAIDSIVEGPDGAIYFFATGVDQRGRLHRFDIDEGRITIPNPELSTQGSRSILVAGSRVLFAAGRADVGDELFAYDTATGRSDLLADLFPGPIESSPELEAVDPAGRWAYVAAISDQGPWGAYRVEAATGRVELLEDPIQGGNEGLRVPAFGADGTVFFARDSLDSQDFEIHRFDPATGRAEQISDLNGTARPLALRSIANGDLISIDLDPLGTVIRRYPGGDGPAVVVGRTDLVGTSGSVTFVSDSLIALVEPAERGLGTLHLVDTATASSTALDNTTRLTKPIITADGHIAVGLPGAILLVDPNPC